MPLSGIIWKDAHEFISGGKDSRIILHSFNDAVRVFDKTNKVAVDMNGESRVHAAISDQLTILANSSSSAASGKSQSLLPMPQLSNTFHCLTLFLFVVRWEDIHYNSGSAKPNFYQH